MFLKEDIPALVEAAKQPMTLRAACEWIARQTGRSVPATSTLWRWTLKGVRGGVRLECFRIGGTTYTTPEMICRFIERTSRSVLAVDVSASGVVVTTADGDGNRQRRREEIAVAQERLREICTPKRSGRLKFR